MQDVSRMEHNLYRICAEGVGRGINWRSPAQLIDLLYGVMGIPPIKKRNSKGFYVPTVNRDALEQLQSYLYAQPIVSHMLSLRDLYKKSWSSANRD